MKGGFSMFNEIDPKLSPYYLGAFSIAVIRKYGELSFDNWLRLVQEKVDFKISEKLFTLAIAWLYMIGKVEEGSEGYFYVQN